ncbi:hypothetical protein ACHHYP_13323 [Achlya hypogyna]|uniref:Uncharacterized protein n=1 Tax=Achlya hypogyna TaxID=1202772 RepID=A0A1V9ZFP8_ACHHY|nr:hypothetical protein ACHHYP_13323 [Achlya hypogyna]
MNPVDLGFTEAIAKGDVAVVMAFVDSGVVDVNTPDRDGDIPLQTAAKKDRLAVLEQLLAYGAHINAADARGWTALHEAALIGSDDIVRTLLKYGADKSLRNEDGQSALDLAVQFGHAPIVFVLCDGHSVQTGFY